MYKIDEHALIIGSQQFGFTFHTRSPKSVIITTLNTEEHYEILNIIEFTNSRKRMSVIIRTPNSKIKLYCKVMFINIYIYNITILNTFYKIIVYVLGCRFSHFKLLIKIWEKI